MHNTQKVILGLFAELALVRLADEEDPDKEYHPLCYSFF